MRNYAATCWRTRRWAMRRPMAAFRGVVNTPRSIASSRVACRFSSMAFNSSRATSRRGLAFLGFFGIATPLNPPLKSANCHPTAPETNKLTCNPSQLKFPHLSIEKRIQPYLTSFLVKNSPVLPSIVFNSTAISSLSCHPSEAATFFGILTRLCPSLWLRYLGHMVRNRELFAPLKRTIGWEISRRLRRHFPPYLYWVRLWQKSE